MELPDTYIVSLCAPYIQSMIPNKARRRHVLGVSIEWFFGRDCDLIVNGHGTTLIPMSAEGNPTTDTRPARLGFS